MKLNIARVVRRRRGLSGILAAVILFAAVFTTGSGFFLFVDGSISQANQANATRANSGIQATQEKLLVTAYRNSTGNLVAMANNTGGVPVTIVDVYVACNSNCGSYQAGQLISNSPSGSHFLQSSPDINVSLPITLGVGASTYYLKEDIGISRTACPWCSQPGEYVVVNLVTSRGNIFSAQYPPPPLPYATNVILQNNTNSATLNLIGGGPQLSVLLTASPTQTFSCATGCITLTATVYNYASYTAMNVSLSLHTPYSDFVSGTASVSPYSACASGVNILAGGSGFITCQFNANTGHTGGLAAFSGHVSGTINGVFVTSAQALSNSVEIGGLASVTTQGPFASNFYFLKYSSCVQDTGQNFKTPCVPNVSKWPPNSINSLPSGSYLAGGSNFYVAFYMQVTNVFNTTLAITQYSYTFGDPDISGEVYYFLAGNSNYMSNGTYYPNYNGAPSLIGYPANCDQSPTPSGCITVAPGQSVYLTFAACGYGSNGWAWGGQQDANGFDKNSVGCTGNPPSLIVPEGMVLGVVISFEYNGATYSQLMPFEGQAYLRSSALSVGCVPEGVAAGTPTTCTAKVSDTDSGGFSRSPTGTVTFSGQALGLGTFSSTTCILSSGSCSVTYTPNLGTIGRVNMTAAYGGDYYFMAAQNSTFITVLRSTSTVVSCSPNTLPVYSSTTCTVTVTDTSSTPITPTGTVGLSNAGSWKGWFSGSYPYYCTLSKVSATSASCTTQFTPYRGEEGALPITATYNGDSNHATSTGASSVTATQRASSTTVTCTPNPDANTAMAVCTATVADATATGSKITPGGTVTFSLSSSVYGSLSPTSCSLSSGACSVNFTPSGTLGAVTVTATYSGDTDHTPSSGSTTLTITTPGTAVSTTVVTCAPNPDLVYVWTTCKVTVTDTSASPTTPTGVATWSQSPTSGSFSSSYCLLSASGGASATCTVNYYPTSAGSITITANYGGDSNHAPSSGSTILVAVNPGPRSTKTSVSCNPSWVASGGTDTCTITVQDTASGPWSTPTGTVAITAGPAGDGTLSSPSCLLSGSSYYATCQVTYVPTVPGATITVSASYPGDLKHQASANTGSFNVKRDVSVTVTCTPDDTSTTRCTVVVQDTDGGAKSTPTGSVTFSSNSTGYFSPSPSCALVTVSTGTARCHVFYTGSGTPNTVIPMMITTTYAGDTQHTGGTNSTVFYYYNFIF